MPDKTDERGDDLAPAALVAALAAGPRRDDAERLLPWFARVTALEPRVWSGSTIGFGRYRYRYASGREGEHFMCGFSPRPRATTIHILPGYRFDGMRETLARLGPHRLGKSCLYVARLDAIDLDVLEEIVAEGMAYLRANYETAER